MATVFALVAGGFLIATRPMERVMARAMRQICAMWTRNFQVSSKERIEEIIVDICKKKILELLLFRSCVWREGDQKRWLARVLGDFPKGFFLKRFES